MNVKQWLVAAVLGTNLAAACAASLPAEDATGWDDVVLVSARKTAMVGRWQWCPLGMGFFGTRCSTGPLAAAQAPHNGRLQDIVDALTTRIPGYKNVAVGPIPVHYRIEGPGSDHVNREIYVAYRHVRQSSAELAVQYPTATRPPEAGLK